MSVENELLDIGPMSQYVGLMMTYLPPHDQILEKLHPGMTMIT